MSMPDYKIVGYFADWKVLDRKYPVTDIPAEKLTHVNYAFFKVSDDGLCTLGNPAEKPPCGDFNQFQQLRQKNPDLQVLFSIGGWTDSYNFSDAALTVGSRERFARSCVEAMTRHRFDGLDIDWEYPVHGGLHPERGCPEDAENFTLLLAELRRQIDTVGSRENRHYWLTTATPAAPEIYSLMQLDRIHPYLDWINLMCYDFYTSWSGLTNFHSALYASSTDPTPDENMRLNYNADATVRGYLQAGVPAEKLVLGVPFYGRSWSGVPDVNHGLYQLMTGLPDDSVEDGYYPYRWIKAKYLDRTPALRHWHAEAQSPWIYDPERRVMIGYEDEQSLKAKADYIKRQQIGGIMIWELGSDDDQHTLLTAVDTYLRKK